MTTWCSHQLDTTTDNKRVSLTVSSSSSSSKGRQLGAAGRHSIAQILGWATTTTDNNERMAAAPDSTADNNHNDMVINQHNSDEQPLDLSLDKTKCRPKVLNETAVPAAIVHKRVEVRQQPAVASEDEPDEDERDVEAEEEEDEHDWSAPHVQPEHLQMAANFSTVLQYYLTAARLWQTTEAIRSCGGQPMESHREDSSRGSHSETGNASPSSELAGTVSVADPVHNNHHPAKRRKKDLMDQAVPAAGLGNPASTVAAAARPRKTRTTFTGKQLFELERIFEQKKYLSSNERQEVARLLSVTGSQIKIWFQNRRTKWKKQDPSTAAELAQLKSASRSQQQQQQHQAGGSGGSTKSNKTGPPSLVAADQAAAVDSDDDAASSSAGQASPQHPPV